MCVTSSLKLWVETDGNAKEATTRMQINWRRVKRQYYEVYIFRSALKQYTCVCTLLCVKISTRPLEVDPYGLIHKIKN